MVKQSDSPQLATFGGGCFWCLDAAFRQVNGVLSVSSGYCGGTIIDPNYQQVCSGNTGHAEVVQITFDPNIVSFKTLTEMFFALHDPTQLNQQGNDVGTQYRSVIFYHDVQQQRISMQVIDALQADLVEPIVTELTALTQFYTAESYHQNYYSGNQEQAYCNLIIGPKLNKFKTHFASYLKE